MAAEIGNAESAITAAGFGSLLNDNAVVVRKRVAEFDSSGLPAGSYDPIMDFTVMFDSPDPAWSSERRQLPATAGMTTFADSYGSHTAGVFVHEMGHRLETQNPGITERAQAAIDSIGEKEIKKHISSMSINKNELAAECFAARVHPDFESLPDRTKQIVNEILDAPDSDDITMSAQFPAEFDESKITRDED